MDAQETELESLVARLTGELSELVMAEILPTAKLMYEELHPETKHGGARSTTKIAGKQVSNLTPWPRFTRFISSRTGVSESTVTRRLDVGEKLSSLDSEARAKATGTPLANQLGVLVRIAALPKQELHRDVVALFANANPKKGKEELAKWEDEFGLSKPKPEPKPEPTSDDDAEPEDAAQPASSEEMQEVMDLLGVEEPGECAEAIAGLKRGGTGPTLEEVGELQVTIQKLRKRNAELEAEVAVLRSSNLGALFQVLGATNVKDALVKARSLMGAHNAAA